eukprot:401208_1
MCSFKWYLQLVIAMKNNKLGLKIWLASLSPNISSIVVKCEIICNEIKNKKFCAIVKFTTSTMGHSWAICDLQEIDRIIRNVDNLTFTGSMTLIDVYHEKTGFNIVNEYKQIEYDDEKIKEIEYKSDSFTWSISNKLQLVLLCNGYIRSRNIVETVINENIIQLCVDYLNWDEITAIRDAENGKYLQSNMFMMSNFKWLIRFYPNGNKQNSEHYLSSDMYLLSLTPSISHFFALCEITIDELDYKYSKVVCWKGNSYTSIVEEKKLKHENIQNIKTLTFKINMTIVDIFDKDGNIINSLIPNTIYTPLSTLSME